MTAQTANTMLGDGVIVNAVALATMQPGYLFIFHKHNYKAGCHWSVSL